MIYISVDIPSNHPLNVRGDREPLLMSSVLGALLAALILGLIVAARIDAAPDSRHDAQPTTPNQPTCCQNP